MFHKGFRAKPQFFAHPSLHHMKRQSRYYQQQQQTFDSFCWTRCKKYEISWTKWSKNTKSDNNRSSLIRYWTWTLALIHTMSMSPLLSFTCVGAWQNTSNSLHMHKPPHSLLYTPLTVVTVTIAVRHPQLGAAKQTIAHRDRLKTSMSKKCILHNIHQLSQLATHSRCALQSSGTTTSLSSSGRNWFKLNHRTVL